MTTKFHIANSNPSIVGLRIVCTTVVPFVVMLCQTFNFVSWKDRMKCVCFLCTIGWNDRNFDPWKGRFEHKSTKFVIRKRLRACRRSKLIKSKFYTFSDLKLFDMSYDISISVAFSRSVSARKEKEKCIKLTEPRLIEIQCNYKPNKLSKTHFYGKITVVCRRKMPFSLVFLRFQTRINHAEKIIPLCLRFIRGHFNSTRPLFLKCESCEGKLSGT